MVAAALRAGWLTSYLKPVQTGSEADAAAVARIVGTTFSSTNPSLLRTSTLFSFTSPISPDLAAARDGAVVTDGEVLRALVGELEAGITRGTSSGTPTFSLVETSGGVLSPGPSGTLQADLFRPLRLPVLLVGDPHLGGIGTTLSVLESLRLRGYTVAGVAFMGADTPHGVREDAGEFAAGNADAVEAELRGSVRGGGAPPIPVFRIGAPLPPADEPLHGWHADAAPAFDAAISVLRAAWGAELRDALTHGERARRRIWWPFTQHSTVPAGAAGVTTVDSAYGNYCHSLEAVAGASGGSGAAAATVAARTVPLHDAPASWWTQGLGHGNPELALAVAEAAGRYGHLLFPNTAHAPAVRLAEALVERGPGAGWAARAFFTDDGSTGMEVAIKMALRRFALDRWGGDGDGGDAAPPGVDLQVVAQAGCYHGDTLGVMDVAERSVFNAGQHPWYSPRGLFLEPPTLAWRSGAFTLDMSPELAAALEAAGAPPAALPGGAASAFASRDAALNVAARSADGGAGAALAAAYEAHAAAAMDAHEAATGSTLGALVMEPLLLGAGGMALADPLWQRALARAARARGLPVVFDEVFSGLWRLGVESAREVIGADPDVAVYAKLLTGGLLPMSVTLASARVFDAFAGDTKAAALLHGHSYTGHPVGCAAALHALAAYTTAAGYRGVGAPMADQWDEDAVRALSTVPGVARALSIGTTLAIELASDARGYDAAGGVAAAQALRAAGVLARPLGNVVYCMVTPHTSRDECARLLGVYRGVLERLAAGAASDDERAAQA